MPQILVIDDEATMRATIRAALEAAGYGATEASSGREALPLLGQTHFDLVVADIFMPEVDGFELIPEMRRKHPGLKIVAISGGGRTGAIEFLDIAKVLGAHRTLMKPFLLHDLLIAIAELLDAPPRNATS